MSDHYFIIASADPVALAATLPGLASFKGASSAAQTAALLEASDRVDGATQYQGRKFDPTQQREFPRVPYPAGFFIPGYTGGVWVLNQFPNGNGPEIWDWDYVNQVAIVPPKVLKAVLLEADWIIAGDVNSDRLNARHDGVSATSADSLSETYGLKGAGAAPIPTLCLRAWQIMVYYQLRQGDAL